LIYGANLLLFFAVFSLLSPAVFCCYRPPLSTKKARVSAGNAGTLAVKI